MPHDPPFWIAAAALGAGATLFMDLAGLALARFAGIAFPDYALVGRWVGHVPAGRFRHPAIARAPAVHGERALGWAVHYAVGAIYAAALLAVAGPGWLDRPTLAPALALGLATVVAPFALMQPAFGAGFAARLTPEPAKARLRSLLNHGLFGLGLYVAGWALSLSSTLAR